MKKARLRKGVLLVLEGIDGSGKSTQAGILLRKLRRLGYDSVRFREPTRGRWGREIRRKAVSENSLTPQEELDLFVRDREENVRKNLQPALAAKKTIVLDRYYFSTIAYQGAKGIDPAKIRRINERFAARPDLVFILDLGAPEGMGRIEDRKKKYRLFERKDYLARVRKIFQGFKGRMFVHIDARGDKGQIARVIWDHVEALLRRNSTSI